STAARRLRPAGIARIGTCAIEARRAKAHREDGIGGYVLPAYCLCSGTGTEAIRHPGIGFSILRLFGRTGGGTNFARPIVARAQNPGRRDPLFRLSQEI